MRVGGVTSLRLGTLAAMSEPPASDATPEAWSDAVRARAFDEYVRQNQASLVRFATLLSGSVAHGEDLVQEVLTRLYPRWGELTGRDGSHHAYVRRSITNEYL